MIGGAGATVVVRAIGPRIVVPMHYGSEAVDFLDPPDPFVDALDARVERRESSEADLEALLDADREPVVLLLAPPLS